MRREPTEVVRCCNCSCRILKDGGRYGNVAPGQFGRSDRWTKAVVAGHNAGSSGQVLGSAEP